MLKNAYLDAKIGVDTAENGPPEETAARRYAWSSQHFARLGPALIHSKSTLEPGRPRMSPVKDTSATPFDHRVDLF